MRDHGIVDRLRAAGLNVIEVDGWRDRGSDTFNPKGSVDHHTGGSAKGNAPSLGVCINGRADLPGPLCNVMVARNNDCYVVAAGKANHAGKGGWHGLSGNSTVYGVERENVGGAGEAWRSDQTDTAAKVHAALILGCDTPDPALVCEHKEWAPTRKTDAHTISGADMRARVNNELLRPPPKPTPLPPEVTGMDFYIIRKQGSDGRWLFFPDIGDLGRRAILPDGGAADEADDQKGFKGNLKLDGPDLDAIPLFRDK